MNYKNESYTFDQIEVMLKFMCKHPLLAYNEFCGEYVGYYSGSFLWNFIKYESYDKRKKVKKALLTAYWLPWTKFKCWLAAKDPCIYELKLEDFEKENDVVSLLTEQNEEDNISLEELDEDHMMMVEAMDFKEPLIMLLISILIGELGVDRFLLGQTGLGILKLVTCGGCGIWWLIDLFKIQKMTRQNNYEKFAKTLICIA